MRPLLQFSRTQLKAFLRDNGQAWIDDPSNENTAHHRVRMRKALDLLDDAGLSRAMIAATAGKLRRARTALETQTDQALDDMVQMHDEGYAVLDTQHLANSPKKSRSERSDGC